MAESVAVIIPALNEEPNIAAAIDSAFRAGADEVIVSDGGSSDRTTELARERGAQLVTTARLRARQLNEAAKVSSCGILLFLHADSTLPPDAVAQVRSAVANGALFGGFRIRFAEPVVRLRVAEKMINLRTAITRCPWGDQGQFIPRSEFERIGGFREMPLMEDYDLAVRMRHSGRSVLLKSAVTTSGRRFLTKGLWRTAAINWTIIAAFRLGVSPERLAEFYRRK